jgi:hypothetical protein
MVGHFFTEVIFLKPRHFSEKFDVLETFGVSLKKSLTTTLTLTLSVCLIRQP